MNLPAQKPASRKDGVEIDLQLRTDQFHFLQQYAMRNGISLSEAFAQLIIAGIQVQPEETNKSQHKKRLHLWVDRGALAVIDGHKTKHGLWRSDVARRLIDDAIAKAITS